MTGGDRPLLNAALKAVDRRLAALPIGAHLGVGTPDAKMLAVIPDRVLAVQIRIGGPQPDPGAGPLDPPTGSEQFRQLDQSDLSPRMAPSRTPWSESETHDPMGVCAAGGRLHRQGGITPLMRRFFALVLSMLLASLGIMAGAAPASAHHNTVSGTAVCEADGTYSVTWQLRNSEAIKEYTWVSSSTPDGSAIVKDTGANPWEVTQTAWPQGPAPTASQSNVAAGATVTFRQTGIPATATRADVTIKGVWTNGNTRTVGPNDNTTYYAGVQLPAGGCGQDITVKPATICGHDTDNTEWHFVITGTI